LDDLQAEAATVCVNHAERISQTLAIGIGYLDYFFSHYTGTQLNRLVIKEEKLG
jgi:hypothetical protein